MNRKQKLDSSNLSVGDTVTVKSDIYLGRWVDAGRTGVIVRVAYDFEQTIYHVNVGGVQYSFVKSELKCLLLSLSCNQLSHRVQSCHKGTLVSKMAGVNIWQGLELAYILNAFLKDYGHSLRQYFLTHLILPIGIWA